MIFIDSLSKWRRNYLKNFPCGSGGKKSACSVGLQAVWSLGWEDPLEKGKATHFSILAWTIPRIIQTMGCQRVRHDWAIFIFSQLANCSLTQILVLFTLLLADTLGDIHFKHYCQWLETQKFNFQRTTFDQWLTIIFLKKLQK